MPRIAAWSARSIFKSRDQMEVLVTIARTGSMTAAAIALGTSHPSIWRVARALEREAGTPLFERHPGVGCVLTFAGALAVARARPILQDMEDADRAFETLCAKLDGDAPKG